MGKCVREDCGIKERLSAADQEKRRGGKNAAGRQKIERERLEYSEERKLRATDGEGCISNVD